jgi:hypothetical protein
MDPAAILAGGWRDEAGPGTQGQLAGMKKPGAEAGLSFLEDHQMLGDDVYRCAVLCWQARWILVAQLGFEPMAGMLDHAGPRAFCRQYLGIASNHS